MSNSAALFLIDEGKLMSHMVSPDIVTEYVQRQNPHDYWLAERRTQQKALPLSLPQVIMSQLRSILWRSAFEEKLDSSSDFAEPISLQEWIEYELARLDTNPRIEDSSYLPELFDEYLRKQDMGLTPWLYFETQWAINHDLEHFYPHVSKTIQERIDYIFYRDGSPLPPGYDIALAELNGTHALWAFFTRQEVQEMDPVIRDAIADDERQILYEDEWLDLLTAHERYNPETRKNNAYDLVALYAMF